MKEKFMPQHSRFQRLPRLKSKKMEVELESMVDDYTEKIFNEHSHVADIEPANMPAHIFGKDEDVVFLMRFNDDEETHVFKKLGFSLDDTIDCHHDIKVKFIPPFV